jgi:hypothetical protein
MELLSTAGLWPYSERNGATASEDMATLLASPEQVLDETERAEAARFAWALYEGAYDDLSCESLRTLDQVRDISTDNTSEVFYCAYFQTASGQGDLCDLGLPPDATQEEISFLLYNIPRMQAIVDAKTRKEISARSTEWYRDMLAARLQAAPEHDASWPEIEPAIVTYEPDKLMDKFADLQAYRHFYRQVWRNLKDKPQTPLLRAQSALLEVYVAWVNNRVADLYPLVWELAMQLDRSQPTEHTAQWEAQLRLVAPLVMRIFSEQQEGREQATAEYFDRFAHRLDLVRNGAARSRSSFSPVYTELLDLADTVGGVEGIVSPENIQFTEEELAVMDKTVWAAEDLQQFNEALLEERNLLSEHKADWQTVQRRDGPAPDRKWQVVVTPKKKTLSVDGAKLVMWVPQKFKRTLTQEMPAGGLPLSAHEQSHVWQTEFDGQVAEQIPIAQLKGRRYVTSREMGGIDQERVVQAAFGRTRATNAHYLRALLVKESGGTITEVARAFYESYLAGKKLEGNAEKEARDTAADRVLRLYRHGGHDSQPLDYLEQDLLVNTLSSLDKERRQAVIIAGGSLSWNDAAKLHRVGLFELPDRVHIDPATEVLRLFRGRYLPSLMKRGSLHPQHTGN